MNTVKLKIIFTTILVLCCLYLLVYFFSVQYFTGDTTMKRKQREDRSSMYDFTKPSISAQRQAVAAQNVINRTIPNHAHRFKIQINFRLESHTFRITKSNFSKIVLIEASSGVIACKGFYYYLKYYLNCHIAWEGSNIKLPAYLPNVNVTETSPSQFIFYQNVCSYSYSYAFWQWPEWRKHIDWMVMQGITLTIAPVQEMIWERVYVKLGLSRKEIDEHFAGPAFLAWQRMGNLRGWGGPLTNSFKINSSALQKRIINALRELGVVIALPAFAGHLPVSFGRLFPNATYRSIVIWKKGFPEDLRGPLFLEPSDELFQKVGTLFLTEMLTEYGSNHIYYADPFYKLEEDLASAKYLTNVANGIYETMKLVDPKAIWMLQSWIFEKNPYLSDDIIKAFLTTVPIGKMILLDLYSEQKPFYNRTSSFHGQPFIWCMLHNFGATLGLHGSVDTLNERFLRSQKVACYKSFPTIRFVWNIGFYSTSSTFLQLYHTHFIAPSILKETNSLFPKYRALFLPTDHCSFFNSISIILTTFYITSALFDLRERDFIEAASKVLYACIVMSLDHYGSYLFLNLLPFKYLIPTLYARKLKIWLNIFLWCWYGLAIWNSPILRYLYHQIYHINSNDCIGNTSIARCILLKDSPEIRHQLILQRAVKDIQTTNRRNESTVRKGSATAFQTLKCMMTLKRKLRKIRENKEIERLDQTT